VGYNPQNPSGHKQLKVSPQPYLDEGTGVQVPCKLLTTRLRKGEKMALVIDNKRGREVARLLYDSFSTIGIHGRNDMPEDIMPRGIIKGSLAHVMFITLTVSIDYQRDAPALWNASRKTFEDPDTRYLFDPRLLHETPFRKIVEDMQKYKLSKNPRKDAQIWRTIGVTFYKKWNSDPRNFLQDCNWDAPTILKRLKKDIHPYNGRLVPDYPYLRGDKIGPLWLRMLRDNVGIKELINLDRVPIPVDVHVARASLAIGVVRGKFSGTLDDLFRHIRKAWFESVKGLNLNIKDRPMIALDMDKPLWHLSKYGCSRRDKITGNCPVFENCELRKFCVRGKIKIDDDRVDLDT